ncbi:hypothetical protein GOV06_01280 [Candidatus Woesearchaeota archaeon]|nr:hypothetical protein [Candidatus Woesearchaeota archaeon]
MADDIFDFENLDSIVRKVFEQEGLVSLSKLNDKKVSIPADYKIKEINLETGEPSEMRLAIEPISQEFEKAGYGPQLFTALYEAVLNAFQHGNKKDSSKLIRVGYKISEEQVDIMVEDQGGELDPNFIPYILEHREERYKNHFKNFYEFSGKEKPSKNHGTGTMFMHQYTDRVNYYHSENDGLIVHMIRKKPEEKV